VRATPIRRSRLRRSAGIGVRAVRAAPLARDWVDPSHPAAAPLLPGAEEADPSVDELEPAEDPHDDVEVEADDDAVAVHVGSIVSARHRRPAHEGRGAHQSQLQSVAATSTVCVPKQSRSAPQERSPSAHQGL